MTVLEMVKDIREFLTSKYMNERILLTYAMTEKQQNAITNHFEMLFDDEDIQKHQTEYDSIVELSKCADIRKSGNDIFPIFRSVYFHILLHHGDKKEKLRIYNTLSKRIETQMKYTFPSVGFSPSPLSIFEKHMRVSRVTIENALHRYAAISWVVKETKFDHLSYRVFNYPLIDTHNMRRYLSQDTIEELCEFTRRMYYEPYESSESCENPKVKKRQNKWILYYTINGGCFPDDEKHPFYPLIVEIIYSVNNCRYTDIDKALENYESAMKYYGKSSMKERRREND